MLYRALIKTHHMTSRRKIAALTKAAKSLSCAVVLKTGRPPGVMIIEASNQENVKSWVLIVKKLRYKDFRMLRSAEVVERGQLAGLKEGEAREFESMKLFRECLEESGVLGWWMKAMGFTKREDSDVKG